MDTLVQNPEVKRYVDLLAACLVPLIAVVATYIAYQQWRNARQVLKLSLYEKRTAVFDATIKFLVAMVNNPAMLNGADEAQKRERQEIERVFLRETSHSRFLFGMDSHVVDYLEELWHKWLHVNLIEQQLCAENWPQDKRDRVAAVALGLRDWLTTERCRATFDPYMALSENAGAVHWLVWRIRRTIRLARFLRRYLNRHGIAMSWRVLRDQGVIGFLRHVKSQHLRDVKPGRMPRPAGRS